MVPICASWHSRSVTPVSLRWPAAVLVAAAAMAFAPPDSNARVSIDVRDADVHNVLRLIADAGQVNVVVPEEVQGKVTLRLHNTRWREALDAVLASRGLGRVTEGNVIYVDTLQRLERARRRSIERTDRQTSLSPMVTRVIPVRYARAADLAPMVRGLLSTEGQVVVDARANLLVVTDRLGVVRTIVTKWGGR